MAKVWVLSHEAHGQTPNIRVFRSRPAPRGPAVAFHPEDYNLVSTAAMSLIYKILSEEYPDSPEANMIKDEIQRGKIGQVLMDFGRYFSDDHRISIQDLPIEYE